MATIARGVLTRTASTRGTATAFFLRATRSATPSINIPLLWQQKRWQASYPPHEVVGMPSLSPTMESGSIAKWNFTEGESFAAGDVLCEVETDKATVDFEAQDDGIIAKILAEAGPAEITCGEPIMITVEDEGDVDAFKDYVVEPTSVTPIKTESVDSEPEPEPKADEAQPTSATSPPSQPPSTGSPPPTAAPSGGRVIASPLAHTVAKELGYNLSALNIIGTGPGGRIIADDVREYVPIAEAAAEAPAAAATAAPERPAAAAAPASAALHRPAISRVGYTDYPVSDAANRIAAQLTHSKQNVPHYYLTVDIAIDKLLELRSNLNESLNLGKDEAGISVNDLLVKAAAVSMKAVPAANASWMDSFVRVYDSVDINVVVGNGDALYSPVIRHVDKLGVKSISSTMKEHMSQLEEKDSDEEGGTALPDDEDFHAVGTFTFMNMGMYGVKSCAPIIREPQACALAIGTIENRIVPNDDENSEEIYKESIMLTATLSCDHRVVDGAVGAQWLSAFKAHVENPSTLLL